MEVACSGEVVTIRAETHGIDEEAVSCMFEVIRSAKFEAPEGGSVVINLPVTFVNPSLGTPRQGQGLDRAE